MRARTGFPWVAAFAYAAVTIGITILILSFITEEAEGATEKFISGDKDQDNILGEGSCPPRKKAIKGTCDPMIIKLPKRKNTCLSKLQEGTKIKAFESADVAADAEDAEFEINRILRGDGSCLRAVAERAEEDEALARMEVEASDGGILMARLMEYRNTENLMFHCNLFDAGEKFFDSDVTKKCSRKSKSTKN